MRVVSPSELTDIDRIEWRRLQRLDPVLESPYLCPEFVTIAAQVRPGVIVVIAEDAGRPVAFLPMQLRGDVGGPVCCPLSDCQAVIAADAWMGDVRDLLHAARVSAYDFNHQRMQRPLECYHRAVFPSPVIDLSEGFDVYVKTMRERGAVAGATSSSGRPHQTIKKAQRISRNIGPVRFTMHDTDRTALHAMIHWKRQQYYESGEVLRLLDIFKYNWTIELLERIHATQSADFSGVLSTLHIGDQLVAAHMGMRSHNVLHWWFPAYDKNHAKSSPGLILLLELTRTAASMGIREIELGPGDEGYKELVANSQIMIASGFVGLAPVPLWLRYLMHGTELLANRLPIGETRTWPGRLIRRIDRMRWLRA
jgi:CelD/BcsL family acetyltransferase involved in cellulose biosynthesis